MRSFIGQFSPDGLKKRGGGDCKRDILIAQFTLPYEWFRADWVYMFCIKQGKRAGPNTNVVRVVSHKYFHHFIGTFSYSIYHRRRYEVSVGQASNKCISAGNIDGLHNPSHCCDELPFTLFACLYGACLICHPAPMTDASHAIVIVVMLYSCYIHAHSFSPACNLIAPHTPPLALRRSVGTKCGHFSEKAFDDELMTGWVSSVSAQRKYTSKYLSGPCFCRE